MSLLNISEATALLSEETIVGTPRARGGRLRHFAGAAGAVLLLGAVAAVACFQVVTPSAAGLVVPAGTANVKFLDKAVSVKDEVEEVEAPCGNATTPCPDSASDPLYDEEDTPCSTNKTTSTPCPDTDVDVSGDVADDVVEETPCSTNKTTSTPCPDTDVDVSGDVVDDVVEETPCSTNKTTSAPCPDTDVDASGDVADDVDEETPCNTNTTTTPCPDTIVDASGGDEDVDVDVPCDNATTVAPCPPVDGTCKDGLFLSLDYNCVATCPSGFYGDKDSRACTACIAGCATCSDSLFCSKCSGGLYLFTEADGDTVCVVTCPADTTADEVSGTCKAQVAIR